MSAKFDAQRVLVETGKGPDEDIDLVRSALALAASQHEGISIDRYLNHIQKMIESVAARYETLLRGGEAQESATKLAALKYVLVDMNDYKGDVTTYDDLQNADLFRVIDRRMGLPIALSILYVHVAQAQGWDVRALNFPGHVLCRIEDTDGERIIFDPFEGGRIMNAAEMRALVKMVMGQQAELSADFYVPASKREMLIRLQNNIKLRQIEESDYKGALSTVKAMRLIHPEEYRLLFDAGLLYARLDQKKAAIHSLERYVTEAQDPQDLNDALDILADLKGSLN